MSDKPTLESIWTDMNQLPRTRSRGEYFDKWLKNIKSSLIDKYYHNFELTNLRLIIIGTSGLSGFNESLAFASEVANIEPKQVPQAVKHLINRINKALGNVPISLKATKSWTKYDFTCTSSLCEVLFLNICLSTNAKLLHNSMYSLEFLHRVLLKTHNVVILDMRMAKNVHVDDLNAVEIESIKKHSALPDEFKAILDKFTKTQGSYEKFIKYLETMHKNIPSQLKLFTLETLKKGPENEFEQRRKEHLKEINQQIASFAQQLPRSDKLKQRLNETIEQDLIALFSKTYQSKPEFKFKLPSNRGHLYARIGNPGETSYSELDDRYVTKILSQLNIDNVIGRLYQKAGTLEDTQTNEISSTFERRPQKSATDILSVINIKHLTISEEDNDLLSEYEYI